MSVPCIIAHRGASATHPENTHAAFDAALAEGCDGIELDLQLTRDGVPVVYHDRTLRKIGGGHRPVRRATAAEIARLDAGAWRGARFAGQRVPRLDDVLARYARRTTLLLEIKVRPGDRRAGVPVALAAALVRRLRRRRLLRRVLVLCFDLDTLRLVREDAPAIRTVLNLEAPRRITPSLLRAIEVVSALSIDVRTISPGIVAAAHERGRSVLAYTCNTLRAVRRAAAAGAEGVMSDRPAWLSRALRAATVDPVGRRR